MSRVWFIVSALVLFTVAAGCSQYLGDFRYSPQQALAEIPSTQPQQPPVVSVLAMVIGVHCENQNEGIPTSVEVRLRVQNNGPAPVVFQSPSLELTNGVDIFPPPVVRPAQPIMLGPSDFAVVSAYFPIPPGRSWNTTDLTWLQLRWREDIAGETVGQVVDFHRVYNVYYTTPYWGYPYYYGYYGGVVVVHPR